MVIILRLHVVARNRSSMFIVHQATVNITFLVNGYNVAFVDNRHAFDRYALLLVQPYRIFT